MRLALAGDTMLGRGVARALESAPPTSLFAAEVVAAAREADLVVLNLECCVSARGERWPDPSKPFFFRAPPAAVEALVHLGVDCVTLANNHALDYGRAALEDTLDLLRAAGIEVVGAGRDAVEAHRPVVLRANGLALRVVAVTDHPAQYAAGPGRAGVAFDPLVQRLPAWLVDAIAAPGADAVLVTPHWGPNMTEAPTPRVRSAARLLLDAGAAVVAGHSAHVFHGVQGPVLYDLGDFVDDYATHPLLRNDLGLLFLLELDGRGPLRLDVVPLKLDFGHTRLAAGDEAAWIRRRFVHACARLGTSVREHGDRLRVEWDRPHAPVDGVSA